MTEVLTLAVRLGLLAHCVGWGIMTYWDFWSWILRLLHSGGTADQFAEIDEVQFLFRQL